MLTVEGIWKFECVCVCVCVGASTCVYWHTHSTSVRVWIRLQLCVWLWCRVCMSLHIHYPCVQVYHSYARAHVSLCVAVCVCVCVYVCIIATDKLTLLAHWAQWNTSCWDAMRLLASSWTSNEAHLCLHHHQLDSTHNATWKMHWAWWLYKHPPCLRLTLTASSFQLNFVCGCGFKCARQTWLCMWVWVLRVIDPPFQGCTPILTVSVIVIARSLSFSLSLSLLTTLSYLITLSAGMRRHTGDCSVI